MDPSLRSLTKAFKATPHDNLVVCNYLQARLRSGLPIEISEIEIATPEIQAILDSAPVELLLVYSYSVDLLRDCVWQPLVEARHPNARTEIEEIRWLVKDKWIAVSCQDIYVPDTEYEVQIQLRDGHAIEEILVSAVGYDYNQPVEQYLVETILDEHGYQGDEYRILSYDLLAPGKPVKWTPNWARFNHLVADWIGPSRWFGTFPRLTEEELNYCGPHLRLRTSNYHREPCQAVREATEKYRSGAGFLDPNAPLFSLPRLAPKEIIRFPAKKPTRIFAKQVKTHLKELQQTNLQEFMQQHSLGDLTSGERRFLVALESFAIFHLKAQIPALTAIEESPTVTHIPVWLLEKYPTIALPT